MDKSLRWRMILALAVLAIGVAYVLPSVPAVKDSFLGRILPSNTINLGLDLKGGIYLTLGVDMDKALENNLARQGDELKAAARESKVAVLQPSILPGRKLEVVLLDAGQQEALDGVLKKSFKDVLAQDSRETQEGNRVRLVFSLSREYKERISRQTLDQVVETIRNRIDRHGVKEPDIRKQQDGRIQVQLPGMQDLQETLEIIRKAGHVEFKIVDDSVAIETAKKGLLPPGREILPLMTWRPDNSYIENYIVLRKEAVFSGEYITDVKMSPDQMGRFQVSLYFNDRGAQIFERVTGENVKKRLAIVLDGKVYSAPVIQEKIGGGRANITGNFSDVEAKKLVTVLKDPLPAPVEVLEQRTVGPSLGQESIDKGVYAAVIAAVAIILFMVVYYNLAGVFADIVLVMNILLTLAALVIFKATLTLPGIAGIILTIGMAVDANVLIYERIREELRLGATAKSAVDKGYSRATLTIVDSNTTNVIVAAILYQFGTGPIRGFAVTMVLGILISMFTAIFVSRIMFDQYLMRRSPEKPISI